MVRPVYERRWHRLRDFARQYCLEIFEENAPRDAIHRKVMNGHVEPSRMLRFGVREVHRRKQQTSVDAQRVLRCQAVGREL